MTEVADAAAAVLDVFIFAKIEVNDDAPAVASVDREEGDSMSAVGGARDAAGDAEAGEPPMLGERVGACVTAGEVHVSATGAVPEPLPRTGPTGALPDPPHTGAWLEPPHTLPAFGMLPEPTPPIAFAPGFCQTGVLLEPPLPRSTGAVMVLPEPASVGLTSVGPPCIVTVTWPLPIACPEGEKFMDINV